MKEDTNDKFISVIKKGTGYLSISTEFLSFFDVINYTGPVSYKNFLNAMHIEQQKGVNTYFPF